MRFSPMYIILIIFSLFFVNIASSETIYLQQVHSKKYVRAGVGKNSYLAATSTNIKAWEKFKLEDLGSNIVALKTFNNKYVRAGIGKSSQLGAVSDRIGGWEKFRLIKLGGSRIALQSIQNGKYVRAGVGDQSYLAAVSSQIKAWETFNMVNVLETYKVHPGNAADLAAEDWCFRVNESDGEITFYPIIKNVGGKLFKSEQEGIYDIGVTFQTFSQHSPQYKIPKAPYFSIASGKSKVLDNGVKVPFFSNYQYRLIGEWVFQHPADTNKTNNRLDSKMSGMGQDFLGNGKFSYKKCPSGF